MTTRIPTGLEVRAAAVGDVAGGEKLLPTAEVLAGGAALVCRVKGSGEVTSR